MKSENHIRALSSVVLLVLPSIGCQATSSEATAIQSAPRAHAGGVSEVAPTRDGEFEEVVNPPGAAPIADAKNEEAYNPPEAAPMADAESNDGCDSPNTRSDRVTDSAVRYCPPEVVPKSQPAAESASVSDPATSYNPPE